MIFTRSSRWGGCVGVAQACMVAYAAPACSQTFVEFGGGWNRLAQPAPRGNITFRRGVNGQVSIGREITPRFSLRLDGLGMRFKDDVEFFPPCPSPGCTRSFFDQESNHVLGLVANAVVNVDPHGIVYLIGGPGLYDAFVPDGELHAGVAGGGGLRVPVGGRLRAFVEARWHYLHGKAAGLSRFASLTVGLHY